VILVDLVRVGASRPGRPLFADLSLTVSTGDRLGVVGINGCGKSTLLRVISGAEPPESGDVRVGSGVRIAMLDQSPHLGTGSVREAAGGTWESDAVLDRLGMGAHLDTDVGQLSGGQSKRVALARALVVESDLLILDEPTNHLDIDAIAWLEERLESYQGGLVMVTHDRHVLDRVTNRTLELDRGQAFVHLGGYDSYLDAKATRAERDAQAEQVRRNLARTELAWLRRGAPARTSKPKARIETATAIVEGRAPAEARAGELALRFGTPRLGDRVVELHGVGHRYAGDAPWLFRDVDLLLDRRERLGVVGPNGTGKSTLLEIVAGRLTPASGRVVVGTTARIGYFDQRGRSLDPDARVREVVAGPHRPPDHTDAALMEAFWFDDDAQFAPVRLLSGGERRRLQLLVTLAEKPNVLLLDEPTNDLDLDTLRALEDFLEEWPGALVVVSHDRAFLERTVADVVVMDGTGFAGRRPGGYAAYEAERRAAPRRRGSVSAPRDRPERERRAPQPSRAPSGRSGRSPSTLRHRFRAVERHQLELRARHDALHAEIVEAGADHVRLTNAADELARVDAELAGADEEWLELAAEAEERGLSLE
jgi:ATP-binding cassette subfamily F protein uup